MTTHLVRLQFVAGGPTVTGEWADGATARRTWRDWVGLYGSDEKVVIRLAEDADGGERVLMAWERGHAVETGSDGSAMTEESGLPGWWRQLQTAYDGTELLVRPSDSPVAAEYVDGATPCRRPGSTPPLDRRQPRPLLYDPAPSPKGGPHARAEPARGLRSPG